MRKIIKTTKFSDFVNARIIIRYEHMLQPGAASFAVKMGDFNLFSEAFCAAQICKNYYSEGVRVSILSIFLNSKSTTEFDQRR